MSEPRIDCDQADVVGEDAVFAPPLPCRRRFSSFWDFVVRGWRPVAAWVGVGVMVVHGWILPLLPYTGAAPVEIDWLGVTAFLTFIFGPLVVARTVEKLRGVTS